MSITRREFGRFTALAGLGTSIARPVFAASRSRLAYDEWIVVDGCGGPGDFRNDAGAPLSARAIEELRGSGVTAVNQTIGVVGAHTESEAFAATVQDLARWQREIDAHPEALMQIRSRADLATAKATGRLGLVFGLQDGVAFQLDLGLLETLRNLGVLIVQPTYNLRNLIGDGCLEPADAGLSRFGHTVIEKMNALGVLLDLSHCGRRTTADALARTVRPPAFTHTGCAALHAHPRNKTDAELRALADKGGVAGIYVMPYLRPSGQPTAEDVLRHLEHAIDVAGEDHVGIGTDGSISPVELTPEFLSHFAGITEARKAAGIGAPGEDLDAYLFAKELNTPRRLETLAQMLARRGHRAARIEKILGGNFDRLFAHSWIPA